jgi:hypothetical protein
MFSGRCKSLMVDGSGTGYLKTVCDYVHLNPARAGLVTPAQKLTAYRWSSYPACLLPARRLAGEPAARRTGQAPAAGPGKETLTCKMCDCAGLLYGFIPMSFQDEPQARRILGRWQGASAAHTRPATAG